MKDFLMNVKVRDVFLVFHCLQLKTKRYFPYTIPLSLSPLSIYFLMESRLERKLHFLIIREEEEWWWARYWKGWWWQTVELQLGKAGKDEKCRHGNTRRGWLFVELQLGEVGMDKKCRPGSNGERWQFVLATAEWSWYGCESCSYSNNKWRGW